MSPNIPFPVFNVSSFLGDAVFGWVLVILHHLPVGMGRSHSAVACTKVFDSQFEKKKMCGLGACLPVT